MNGAMWRQARRALLIVVVTAAAFGWATWARNLAPEQLHQGLSPADRWRVDPYRIGMIFQLTVVPVALIYLLSGTRPFEQVVKGEGRRRDLLRLGVELAAVQVVVEGYALWFSHLVYEPPLHHFACLTAVVAGLLGGWPLGLGVGLATMLVRGTRELALQLRYIIPPGEQLPLSMLGEAFIACYSSMWGWSPVWAGVVAGLWGTLWGRWRFAPPVALTLGSGIGLVLGGLRAVAGDRTALFFVFLMPDALVLGAAMTVIALTIRAAQAEAARRRAEAAELARTHAELRALRAQINPHFLFNALNTIRYFVRTDPEAARHLLLNLSAVFRRALGAGEFVTLSDELEHVRASLALEKARLGERLRVVWDIRAGEWLEQRVPALILQPVVENAIIHGVAQRPQGGTVRITIERTDDDLVLQVQDDGPGIAPHRLRQVLAQNGGRPVGLRNVDSRLQALYGPDHRLNIHSKQGEGTCVQIRIPLSTKTN